MLKPADLKTGNAVKYTIQDNVIRTVEVTEGVERTVEGVLTELTSSTVVYKKQTEIVRLNCLALNRRLLFRT